MPARKPANPVHPAYKRQILWEHAACLLARGHGVCAVASELGVSRTTIWRALKNSRAFQDMVATEYAEMAVEAGGRMQALRDKVSARIERKVEEDDTRVILWLADRLGLVGPHYAKRKMIDQTDPKWFQHDEALERLSAEGMIEQDERFGNGWRNPDMQAEIDRQLSEAGARGIGVIDQEPAPEAVDGALAAAGVKPVADVASAEIAAPDQQLTGSGDVAPMLQNDASEASFEVPESESDEDLADEDRAARLELPSPFHPRGEFEYDPYAHLPWMSLAAQRAVEEAREAQETADAAAEKPDKDIGITIRRMLAEQHRAKRAAA